MKRTANVRCMVRGKGREKTKRWRNTVKVGESISAAAAAVL